MEAKDLLCGELPEITLEEEASREYLLSVSRNNDWMWDDFDLPQTFSIGVDEPIQPRNTDLVVDTYGAKGHQSRDISEPTFDSMPVDHDLQCPVLDSMHLTYDSHDPVLGPATLEFLETYTATAIAPTSASSNITESEACIYPLDTLTSLENANLGPLVQDANLVIELISPAKSAPCAVEVDTTNQDASITPTSVTPTTSDVTVESNSPKSSVTSVNRNVEPSETTKQKQGVQPGQAQKEETSKPTPRKGCSKAHESFTIRSSNQTSPTEATPRKLAPAPATKSTVRTSKKCQKAGTPASTAPIPTSTTPQRAVPALSTGIEFKTPCKPQKQVPGPILTPLHSVAATPNPTTISETPSTSQSGYAASRKTVMQAVLPPTPQSLPLPQGQASLLVQSVPTSQYDPSIHHLQTAYEAKQHQAKIEHQNNSRVQKLPPQQKLTNKQRLVLIQKGEQLKRLQEQLNTHAEQLNMEREQMYRKRDALLKQPAELTIQERKIASEQWKLFKEKCQKHKTEKDNFDWLQGQLGLRQEDQATSKPGATPQFQSATQTQVASPSKPTPQHQASQQQAVSAQFQVSRSEANPQHQTIQHLQHQTSPRQTIQRQATPQQVTRRKAVSQYQAPSQPQVLPQYQAVPEFQASTKSRSKSLQQPQAPVPARPRQTVNNVSPSTSHTQSISPSSSAAHLKRGFSNMNSAMTQDKVATNPVVRAQWSLGSSGDSTNLNGPPIKKFKWALK